MTIPGGPESASPQAGRPVRLTLPGGPPGSVRPGPAARSLWADYSQYLVAGAGMGQPLDASALLADAGFTHVAAQPVEVDLPMPGGGEMLWRWHLTHGTVAFIDGLPSGPRAAGARPPSAG